MGRMSELAQELAELKRCGEILIGISESLTEMFTAADEPVKEEAAAEPVKEKPKKAKEPAAFCGELGTNNPEEERSIELLKKIIVRNEGGDIDVKF